MEKIEVYLLDGTMLGFPYYSKFAEWRDNLPYKINYHTTYRKMPPNQKMSFSDQEIHIEVNK